MYSTHMNGYEQMPVEKSFDDQMQEDFSIFLDKEEALPREVTVAYLALFDIIKDDDIANLSEKEQVILKKMQEMEQQKFPVNRFAEMITFQITPENARNENRTNLSPEDKMIDDFVDAFVVQGDYTSQEMMNAYLTLSGVNEDHEKELSDKEQILLAKMREMEDEKVPLSTFIKIVRSKERLEKMPQQYESFIDTFDISKKERQVLKSIVRENRSGMLTLTFRDLPENEVNINIHNNGNSKPGQELKALELVQILSAIMSEAPSQEGIEITFEEE